MCLKIILKVTKTQGFTLFLEDTFFKKPQGEEVKLTPPTSPFSCFRVKTKIKFEKILQDTIKYKNFKIFHLSKCWSEAQR